MREFFSKIFIDGGDPAETKEADAMLKKAGYHGLDGQTTNPTLIAKRLLNAAAAEVGVGAVRGSPFTAHPSSNCVAVTSSLHTLRDGARKDSPRRALTSAPAPQQITASDASAYYRKTVEEIGRIIPEGQISIQVIGDPAKLTVDEMLSQARDRITWIPNAVIKFPVTKTGLKAAEIFCQEGPVNMTLAFSQEQAAAVYAATKAHNYDVFISPFVGRLDDRGENGMDVVANILEMYRELGDGHVQVLTASVRNVKHILYALWIKSDVITIPFKVFKEWAGQNFTLPPKDFLYDPPTGEAGEPGLTEIEYRELTLDKEWTEYDLFHDLTDVGLTRFWEDWKGIVE
ncbi:transaldolase [Candidatus Gottesmanbacteria bacterium]|nr:transaldolase [Candidatus Gottesmanbacteria bacterium]